MEHLEIHLLGSFMVVYAGEQLASLRATRLQALLAYLLLHRGAPQPRQRIAFLFWPETSDRQAQTNLRQLLHTLKQRIPNVDACLQVDEHTIAWRGDAPCTLDVADFEHALATAARRAGAARIAALESAVAFYAGDLLPECYDDWIMAPREQLAQQFVAAFEQLVLPHEEQRNYPAAIAHAQRLLAYDPLHEVTYRRLMRLCALNGDRAAALRVYHTCVSLLERELGAPPSLATREVYERLLQVDDAHLARHSPQSPFVGRKAAWQALQTQWRTANRGGLHVVCIQGEAGIGKTRIAEELLHWAQQQGIRTLHAHAYASESSMSYAPLVESLRAPVAQPALAQLAPVWRTELARLLPELLAADPALPAPEPLTEGWQRQRLYDALLRTVAPAPQPLIVLLDDLQWCDAETLDWLLYLVNHRMDARMLLVATARSEEVTPEHPAAQYLLELRRLGVLTDLPLGALDAAETALLAAGVAGQRLADSHARQIYAATEGNPLFVVETVRNLDDADGDAADVVVLPPRVQGVIRARLAQLSPAARDLASVAATIGRSFNVDVLTAACDHDEYTVVRSLDELWQRRIVREQGVNGYDFTHDRLREVAYAALQPAQRRLLHHRIAAALERCYPNADALCVQLAHHYEQAGLTARAIHSLQRAAASAQALYANRDAIVLLERTLTLLHMLPAGQSRIELELEVQMALCSAWGPLTSHLGVEVTAAYNHALALCRQLRQTPHLFTVLWGLHEIALYRGDYRKSLGLATQCLEIAHEVDDASLLLEAYHALWAPHFFLGEYPQAIAYMEAGLAIYDRRRHEPLSVTYGAHDAGSCALTELPIALWQMGYPDQARRRLEAAIAHAHHLIIPANIADAYGYAALSYHLLCDPEAAQRFAEPALRIFSEKDMLNAQYMSATTLGWSLAMQGQHAEGVALTRQGLNIAHQAQHQLHASQLTCMVAEACMMAGHLVEAIDVLDEGIARFSISHDLICAPDLHTLKAKALLALDADDQAVEACCQVGLSLAQALGAKISELRVVTQLARLRQRQGQLAEAVAALSAIYCWFTEGFDTSDLMAAQQLLTELSSAGV